MRFRIPVALVPLLLALCAVAVPARAASSPGHLDRSFGRAGIATTGTPSSHDQLKGFTVAARGRVYVLDGSLLLAFQGDGKVARDFGENGRVTVAPASGIGAPVGIAADSRGRLLIAGWTDSKGRDNPEAYVIRVLSDGRRDPGFGGDGEVDTDFGLPLVGAGEKPTLGVTSISVDAKDRPVVGGSFGKDSEPCGITIEGGPVPFVGRLTASGGIDQTFGGTGHTVLAAKGNVISLAQAPAGELVVFSRPCSTPPRLEIRPSAFTALGEGGEPSGLATERGLYFSYSSPKVDPDGRIVEIESPQPAAEGRDALARYLPNGDRDPGFGLHGRVVLRDGGASAFAVDAEGRPIIVQGVSLKRFLSDGKIDPSFGPGGLLKAKGTAPRAIAFDPQGRIYTVSLSHTSSRTTVKVARFIPGGPVAG